MKPIERTKLIFAAAALCFCCSCSSEMTDVNEGNSYQFLIASSDLAHFDSKTCIQSSVGSTGSYVPVLWMPSDELGVYTSAESNIKYTKYNQTSNEEVAAFVTSETVTGTPQVAYYPYSESAGTDPTSLLGSIPEIQTMDPATGSLPGDCKIGVYQKTTSNGAEFKFTHLFSPVQIIINGEGTDVSSDNLKYIEFNVTRNGVAVPVCGTFTFNATTGAYSLSNTSNSITFDWTTKPSLASQAQAFGTVFPEIKTGDVLTFAIHTPAHTATVTVTSKVDFKPNTLYTFPLTLSNLTANTVIESNSGDSGNTGGDITPDGSVTTTGMFTCATYNIDGLPQKVSIVTINGDGPGSNGTKSISSKIASDNWDFVGFSEDFAYHTELTSALSAWTFGTYRGSVSSISSNNTDGLGFATKNSTCSFSNESITQFTSSSGGISSGANTCIKKGFRHYEVTVATGVVIDVLITHMNTYSSSGTGHINAQHAQLKQIAQYVNSIRGNKRPIIIMGDTNCRYTRHDFQTYFWGVLNSDLVAKDPWVEYQWDGVYPTYPSNSLMVSDATGTSSSDIICENTQKGEVVDKIIYINNPDASVQIKANSYLRDYEGYNGLADHMPIVVEFTYEKYQ